MPRPSPVTIVLGVLCLGALGIATNVATSTLPESWRGYLWLAWPAVPVLLGAAAVIEIRRARAGGSAGADSPRARVVLLDRVRRYWVRGVLEQSLYQEARIDLGMTVTVDAPHPWDVVVARPDGSSRTVPAGTTMADVFDELDQTMLALGAPGSGKTTMMLELARDLLHRADTDAAHPIPVVLTLSSWALRREPLADWIVRELALRYEIPASQARIWLNTDQLIPLLDGLDEVAEEHQPACVTAINDFRAQRGATRLLVCCRTIDYERLRDPLRTYGTLTIQPLTTEQVEAFLDRAGQPVAAVRVALAADSLLRELIQSPLLLSIAVLAYRDAAIGTVATGEDIQQLRDRLFATYIRTMLTRRRSDQHSARQTVRRLAFLAELMRWERQTVFTLELLDVRAVPGYDPFSNTLLTVRLSIRGLVGGLVLGVAGLIAYGWLGGLAGAAIGAVGLLLFPLIDSRAFSYQRTYHQERQWRVKNRIAWGFDGPITGFAILRHTPFWLAVSGAAAVAGALLGWSAGLFTSVVYGVAAAVAVLTAVILCLGYSDLDAYAQRVEPREGRGEIPSPIARAVLRRGSLTTLLVTLVTPILPGLLVAWAMTRAEGYRFTAVVAVGAAMFALLSLGGFGVVEQTMVRLTLRRRDLAPLPLRPFLDYATQCLFLRQVGDSYLFVHLSLLEFFAGMWRIDDVPSEQLDELVSG